MKKKIKKNQKKLKDIDEKEKTLLNKVKPGEEANPNKEAPSKPLSKEELLNEQLKQSQNNYLYLKADFENFKKQSFKERQDLIRYGGQHFIQTLIENVLDDLERALELNDDEKTFGEFKKGIKLILKNLHDTFNRFGIEVIDPVGKPFDPNYQEALSREKTSKVPEGHVSRTFKKAYKFHDKVIRPAQVVVAEKTPEDS